MEIKTIENIVCKHYGLTPKMLFERTRRREIKEVRQVFHYLCRKHTKATTTELGCWSKRNHATILHSVKTVKNLLETDKHFRLLVGEVESEIIEMITMYKNEKTNFYKNALKIANDVIGCKNEKELNQLLLTL